MCVLILGGTGFIGSALVRALLAAGYTVRVCTRGADRDITGGPSFVHWDGHTGETLAPLLDGTDAVINLLGENIGAGRWTAARKHSIQQSRLRVGEALSQAFLLRSSTAQSLPQTLLQASATGYYGLWEDANYTPCCAEDSESGQGFLAETCILWEASTSAVESLGVRRCILRTAPVIGFGGGFLSKMLPSFRYYLGGVMGTGLQSMSWIHLDDEVAAILFLLKNTELRGPFNLSSPNPVTMQEFALTLGKLLHRPVVFPLPGFLLECLWGQMARELLLSGQKAVPSRLKQAGFIFSYPRVEGALNQVLKA